MDKIDPDKLFFPCDLTEAVGLSNNEVAYLKRKGCPFYGRKTTLRWVRNFLAHQAGASPPIFPNDTLPPAVSTVVLKKRKVTKSDLPPNPFEIIPE